MNSLRRAHHLDTGFLAVVALVILASAAVTISDYISMSTMPGMEMPGGWTMSMTWMRMPGQSWAGAAAAFLGMWTVMMVAMMAPAVTPALLRYRQAVGVCAASRLGRLTTFVALGYFAVWTLAGIATFPVGMALAELTMQVPAVSRAVPIIAGCTIILAGALQFTAWKAGQLHCCRTTPIYRPADSSTAWQHGWRLGASCVRCCAGLTAILLVLGVMDLRAMTLVTLAITAERVAPAGQRIARVIGAMAIVTGLIQLARI
jgi:predicted metal-binding membrane protein